MKHWFVPYFIGLVIGFVLGMGLTFLVCVYGG
jgi:hypothetical protein